MLKPIGWQLEVRILGCGLDHGDRTLTNGICALRKKRQRVPLLLPPCDNTGTRRLYMNQEMDSH